MTESQMTAAREIAAQCWCDDETQHLVMDVRLAEAFAKRLAPLMMHHVTIARAMAAVRHAIREESGPGTYHDSWLANIAMPILDMKGKLDLATHEGATAMAVVLLDHFFPKKDPTICITSPTERAIVESKQWRADLDAILQDLKGKCTSAERSTAKRKLVEAIMWLGMDLKETNASRPREEQQPSPYPSSYDPSTTRVDPTADGLRM